MVEVSSLADHSVGKGCEVVMGNEKTSVVRLIFESPFDNLLNER